jgi:hypothetical protein
MSHNGKLMQIFHGHVYNKSADALMHFVPLFIGLIVVDFVINYCLSLIHLSTA